MNAKVNEKTFFMTGRTNDRDLNQRGVLRTFVELVIDGKPAEIAVNAQFLWNGESVLRIWVTLPEIKRYAQLYDLLLEIIVENFKEEIETEILENILERAK